MVSKAYKGLDESILVNSILMMSSFSFDIFCIFLVSCWVKKALLFMELCETCWLLQQFVDDVGGGCLNLQRQLEEELVFEQIEGLMPSHM